VTLNRNARLVLQHLATRPSNSVTQKKLGNAIGIVFPIGSITTRLLEKGFLTKVYSAAERDYVLAVTESGRSVVATDLEDE
jgi:DNA-binding MarR family transcriptional regulator